MAWNHTHVNSTTQIFSGQGVLHTVVLNGLTTAGDVGIWNGNTAAFPFPFPLDWGDIIAMLHLNPTTSISLQPVTLHYDIECPIGLYLDFDGTVVADLTVSYK